MITIKHRGDFSKTTRFLSNAAVFKARPILNNYGEQGVKALESATPADSGVTANSWGYKTSVTKKGYSINWFNSNTSNGIPIVILLQYGHATGNGGYVQGRDFINPAIKPILDKIADKLLKEVLAL